MGHWRPVLHHPSEPHLVSRWVHTLCDHGEPARELAGTDLYPVSSYPVSSYQKIYVLAAFRVAGFHQATSDTRDTGVSGTEHSPDHPGTPRQPSLRLAQSQMARQGQTGAQVVQMDQVQVTGTGQARHIQNKFQFQTRNRGAPEYLDVTASSLDIL